MTLTQFLFPLVVDNFGIKYVNDDDVKHLIAKA